MANKPLITRYGPTPTVDSELATKAYVDTLLTTVRKLADETVSNSISLQDDDELVLPVLANTVYKFSLNIFQNTSTVADLRSNFAIPAGASIIFSSINGVAGSVDVLSTGAGVDVGNELQGILVVVATAGTLQYRWAQQTAEVSDTKILTNSTLVIRIID